MNCIKASCAFSGFPISQYLNSSNEIKKKKKKKEKEKKKMDMGRYTYVTAVSPRCLSISAGSVVRLISFCRTASSSVNLPSS